jgi:23S rRNA U2552 (ribose-2'-O)-methylase RlmE/FtsJ
VVLDLGAAPGGWTEYACRRLADHDEARGAEAAGWVVAVDLLPLDLGGKAQLGNGKVCHSHNSFC